MNHQGTVNIETKRLVLRKFKLGDGAAAYQNWTSEDKVTEFLRWPTHLDIETSENVVKMWVEGYNKPDFYQWAITLKEHGDEPIGTIGVVEQNEELGIVHIGYCIGSKWWHQGITSEAFSAIIPFLFEQVGVNRIESEHDPKNMHSGNVMTKCGLVYEGTLREADFNNTGIVDAALYSILRSEYEKKKEQNLTLLERKEHKAKCQFQSEYADVCYREEDNTVLLTWKREAHLESYREPTLYALKLLQEHLDSNFIIDATNGFEDDKRDVEWGTKFLLPEISKTTCRFVCFIMNENHTIDDEMDMWTVEFGKYFAVTRASDYKEALYTIHHYIMANVTYIIKEGKRDEFVCELIQNKIQEDSMKEAGNIQYDVFLPIGSINKVCLVEFWTNETEQKRHTTTFHYKLLSELKQKYVEQVLVQNYHIVK